MHARRKTPKALQIQIVDNVVQFNARLNALLRLFSLAKKLIPVVPPVCFSVIT